jgi:hypothetical protein
MNVGHGRTSGVTSQDQSILVPRQKKQLSGGLVSPVDSPSVVTVLSLPFQTGFEAKRYIQVQYVNTEKRLWRILYHTYIFYIMS